MQEEFGFARECSHDLRPVVWGVRGRLRVDEVYKIVPDHLADLPAFYVASRVQARSMARLYSALPGKGFVLVFKGRKLVENRKVKKSAQD
ncbi:hypothetical protein H5P28_07040 [Ruficoccus amylovorans]|uniref:Uncharacterized protein n=1 Tax=Ruficoccus amylovorans TaxID=1804625 RepID=A0A842HER1_9BACT|nr:hypothetical protein [Ruficoccus amylovorans]MBC2594014.1 hypothetical protein [Ruficoccus amylovorans]